LTSISAAGRDVRRVATGWNDRGGARVNEALRRGLEDMTARKNFETRSVALGRLKVADLDNIADALAVAEGEAFK